MAAKIYIVIVFITSSTSGLTWLKGLEPTARKHLDESTTVQSIFVIQRIHKLTPINEVFIVNEIVQLKRRCSLAIRLVWLTCFILRYAGCGDTGESITQSATRYCTQIDIAEDVLTRLLSSAWSTDTQAASTHRLRDTIWSLIHWWKLISH